MKKIYNLYLANLLLTTMTLYVYTMQKPIYDTTFLSETSLVYDLPQYFSNSYMNTLNKYITYNNEAKRKASSNNTSQQSKKSPTKKQKTNSSTTVINTSLNNNNNYSYCSQDDLLKLNGTIKNEQINNSTNTNPTNFTCNNQINMVQLSQQNSQISFNNTNFTTATNTAIFKHIVDHHTDTVKFQCLLCMTILASKDNLKRHLKNIHSIKQESNTSKQNKKINHPLHNCLQCDKKYPDKDSLKDHVNAVHNKKRIKCNYCDNTYSYRSGLHLHIKNDHN